MRWEVCDSLARSHASSREDETTPSTPPDHNRTSNSWPPLRFSQGYFENQGLPATHLLGHLVDQIYVKGRSKRWRSNSEENEGFPSRWVIGRYP
ncbi:unnamed protein product [Fusarium venenatum]|uniref:Uncharacterized protein n=1 Tax=Fusarium venenatum TaxID=56646 RepID=A0A2L2TXP8_9HYPO|nr:uncharacterized protein FVRRES_02057 [Fusarium venenatum]CEI65545.1 unnamed protein product [Fusarium venenatum]